MKRELKGNHKIVYAFICLLMAFTLTNTIGEVLSIAYTPTERFLITALIGGATQLIVAFPFSLYLILLGGLPAVILYNHYNRAAFLQRFISMGSFFSNLWRHIRYGETLLQQHTKGLWLLLAVAICLITAYALFRLKRKKLLLPVYLYFLIYYWYIHINIAYPMMGLFLLLYVILTSLEVYYRRIEALKEERIRQPQDMYRIWLKTIISYGLIIMLLASLLPKLSYRANVYWLETRLTKAFPVLVDLRDDFEYNRNRESTLFSLTETGYQESRTLGGPIRQSERLVMKVKAPQQLYLRGNIRSLYSKNSWFSEDKEYTGYRPQSLLPIEAVQGREIYLEITYGNLSTNTLFTPYQPVEVLLGNGGGMRVNKEFQVITDKAMYKNDKYIIKALLPDEIPGEIGTTAINVEEKYLQLPLELSPNIKEMADAITRGIDTPYLKAIAIRDHLRSNYTYATDVPIVPFHKEFVEYFLFEEKQGYCTYFATALAIMLRTQNIPARYIEGYVLPSKINSEGLYEVRQKNAHAWVEAYFPEMGWITIEATPAYSPAAEIRPSALTREGEDTAYFDELQELELLLEQQRNSQSSEIQAQAIQELEADLNSPAAVEGRLDRLIRLLRGILPALLQLLIFALLPTRSLYMYFKIKSHRKKHLKGDNRLAVVGIYSNILQLLALLGYPVLMGETPYEYSARTRQHLFDNHHDFGKITEILILTKYSSYEPTDEEKAALLSYMDFVERKVRYDFGVWKFNYLKYIRGSLYSRL